MSIPFALARPMAVLCLLVLAGCGDVTPRGLLAAARLDPLGTDPGAIAAALEVPEMLRLRSGDAVLRLTFRDDDDALRIDEAVELGVEEGARGLAPAEGTRLFTATIAPGDRARFADAQAAIRRLRAEGTRGAGSLSVRVTGGCLQAPLAVSLPVRTFLSVDGGAFVPLTRRANLFDRLSADEARALRDRLAPC